MYDMLPKSFRHVDVSLFIIQLVDSSFVLLHERSSGVLLVIKQNLTYNRLETLLLHSLGLCYFVWLVIMYYLLILELLHFPQVYRPSETIVNKLGHQTLYMFRQTRSADLLYL